jgi:ketosteroid isomerase-like protein
MRKTLLLCGLVLAACSPAGLTPVAVTDTAAVATPPPAPVLISEADAAAIIEKIPALLVAGDANAAVATYTPDAVLIDAGFNELITDAKANLEATEDFIKEAAPTKFVIHQQKIQVLDADTFVASMIGTGEMKNGQKQTYRVTQVAHRQADGSWKIVNEHLSGAPMTVGQRTQPLPTLKTIPPS